MMGNAVKLESPQSGQTLQIPAERPTYLRVTSGDVALLEKALAGMQTTDLAPVEVVVRPSGRGGNVAVTVTGRSRTAQDGVVEIVPTAGSVPAAQHFQSLANGESRTLKFTMPDSLSSARDVRVRVGDREVQEVKATWSPSN